MKVILFTGSTGGIDLEAAKTRVKKGHHIMFLHGRNPKKLKQVEAENFRKFPALVQWKLTYENQADSLVVGCETSQCITNKMIVSDHEHSDLLINNAGVFEILNTHMVEMDSIIGLSSIPLAKQLLPLIPKHGCWACWRNLTVPLDKQKHSKALHIY